MTGWLVVALVVGVLGFLAWRVLAEIFDSLTEVHELLERERPPRA